MCESGKIKSLGAITQEKANRSFKSTKLLNLKLDTQHLMSEEIMAHTQLAT